MISVERMKQLDHIRDTKKRERDDNEKKIIIPIDYNDEWKDKLNEINTSLGNWAVHGSWKLHDVL